MKDESGIMKHISRHSNKPCKLMLCFFFLIYSCVWMSISSSKGDSINCKMSVISGMRFLSFITSIRNLSMFSLLFVSTSGLKGGDSTHPRIPPNTCIFSCSLKAFFKEKHMPHTVHDLEKTFTDIFG